MLFRVNRLLFRRAILVFITTGLFCVTSTLFLYFHQVERKRIEDKIYHHATIKIKALENNVQTLIHQIEARHAILTQSSTISQTKFRHFSETARRHIPSFQSSSYQRVLKQDQRQVYESQMRRKIPNFVIYHWVSNQQIPAPKSNTYVVVTYVEPEINQNQIGQDILLDATQGAIAKRARDTGLPTASALKTFMSVDSGAPFLGFLIFIPVYETRLPPLTITERRKTIIGYTRIVMGADQFIQATIGTMNTSSQSRTPETIYMHIYAQVAENNNQTALSIINTQPDHPISILESIFCSLFAACPITIKYPLFIAGEEWIVEISSPAPSLIKSYPISIFTLIIGGLTTLLGAIYAHVWLLRHRNPALSTNLTSSNNVIAHEYDIATIKHSKHALEHQLRHDSLTRLMNHHTLSDYLEYILNHAAASHQTVWVAALDINRFKFINDALGYEAGNQLLIQIAERLKTFINEERAVSRISGSKFILILNHKILNIQLLYNITELITQPIEMDGHTIFLACNIGISVFPQDSHNAESLLKHANIAMCRAKESGSNHYRFYAAEMNEHALKNLKIEASLHIALDQNQFTLHYQPQVSLLTGQIVGMEALIRWKHPTLGIVSPGQFISLAEETGLIIKIGEWVIRAACLQNKQWQDRNICHLPISVNLSARQFSQENLLCVIQNALDETQLSPEYLGIELTETLVVNDIHSTASTLENIKKLGIKLSIDDFGTGHSGLSYLKIFHFDKLKIDQSFIQDIVVNRDASSIVDSIISLAHNLRLTVVAEGVETQKQLSFLQASGCDQIQGFYFSQPLHAEAMKDLLLKKKTLACDEANF